MRSLLSLVSCFSIQTNIISEFISESISDLFLSIKNVQATFAASYGFHKKCIMAIEPANNILPGEQLIPLLSNEILYTTQSLWQYEL